MCKINFNPEKDMKAEEKAMRAYPDHEGLVFDDERKAFVKGYEQALKDIWHKATDTNDLPEIDREVVALQGLKGGGYRIVFAHRPQASWVGTNIFTGEKTVRKPKRYGKGKWNMENVKWWLDVELPKAVTKQD